MNLPGAAAFVSAEPAKWYWVTMANRHGDADAYLLSCTMIRTGPVIAALEPDPGKPVITSDQAPAWHAVRHGQITEQTPGFGALFRAH